MTDVLAQRIDQVTRMITAGNTADQAGLAACFTEDLLYQDFATGLTYHGPGELVEAVEGWWTTSNPHMEPHQLFATETAATVEWTLSGTLIGAMPGLPAIKAAGKEYSFPGVTVIEFSTATGQISRQADYWNMAVFLAQIGIDSLSELRVR